MTNLINNYLVVRSLTSIFQFDGKFFKHFIHLKNDNVSQKHLWYFILLYYFYFVLFYILIWYEWIFVAECTVIYYNIMI